MQNWGGIFKPTQQAVSPLPGERPEGPAPMLSKAGSHASLQDSFLSAKSHEDSDEIDARWAASNVREDKENGADGGLALEPPLSVHLDDIALTLASPTPRARIGIASVNSAGKTGTATRTGGSKRAAPLQPPLPPRLHEPASTFPAEPTLGAGALAAMAASASGNANANRRQSFAPPIAAAVERLSLLVSGAGPFAGLNGGSTPRASLGEPMGPPPPPPRRTSQPPSRGPTPVPTPPSSPGRVGALQSSFSAPPDLALASAQAELQRALAKVQALQAQTHSAPPASVSPEPSSNPPHTPPTPSSAAIPGSSSSQEQPGGVQQSANQPPAQQRPGPPPPPVHLRTAQQQQQELTSAGHMQQQQAQQAQQQQAQQQRMAPPPQHQLSKQQSFEDASVGGCSHPASPA
ncbi:hypothetical protein T492DRAFT_912646, partial [Pavlovales sp. CCMP2436]